MQFDIISQKKAVYKKGRAKRYKRQARGDMQERDFRDHAADACERPGRLKESITTADGLKGGTRKDQTVKALPQKQKTGAPPLT